jgi:hypothetical protein
VSATYPFAGGSSIIYFGWANYPRRSEVPLAVAVRGAVSIFRDDATGHHIPFTSMRNPMANSPRHGLMGSCPTGFLDGIVETVGIPKEPAMEVIHPPSTSSDSATAFL